MAVRTSCPHCSKRFSAPNEYLGKKVECPRCGKRVIVRTPEQLEEEAQSQRQQEKLLAADREKIALIESIEGRGKKAGRPYYEEFGTGSDAVRHFNPRSPTKFARLRALSDLLVLGAYLELLLVAVGIGLTFYLWMQGTLASAVLLILAIIVWMVVGGALYLAFKSLGELAHVYAEIGDRQHDLVQLLLDVRENTNGSADES